MTRDETILKIFPEGTWVTNTDDSTYVGCSQVFIGYAKEAQPFSYLNSYNPKDFRLATQDEINASIRETE